METRGTKCGNCSVLVAGKQGNDRGTSGTGTTNTRYAKVDTVAPKGARIPPRIAVAVFECHSYEWREALVPSGATATAAGICAKLYAKHPFRSPNMAGPEHGYRTLVRPSDFRFRPAAAAAALRPFIFRNRRTRQSHLSHRAALPPARRVGKHFNVQDNGEPVRSRTAQPLTSQEQQQQQQHSSSSAFLGGCGAGIALQSRPLLRDFPLLEGHQPVAVGSGGSRAPVSQLSSNLL
ncbi:hypothetical protein AND_001679 [Anopheles darlingi]|uniref:Uncharacterized protein n=1 Tax=Anopheles darlingi TaxID=43151 RepID=W5JQY5_ANODA|nr:hypothetical protein AND_001679 [Anopheles darlingi]